MGPAAAAPCPRATGLPRPWGPPGPRDGRAGGRAAGCILRRPQALPRGGRPGGGDPGGGASERRVCGSPVPEHCATDGPGIPVTVGFIYSPASAALRTAWPGRGGRPGGRRVEGRREVRCSRGPESFLVGPNWGLPSLRGAPVLAPGTPRGRAGEHSAGSKLFASSCPFKVLRPCTPRPRPTPLPAITLGAANSPPFPTSSQARGEAFSSGLEKFSRGFS